MKTEDIENYRVIEVTFLNFTDTLGKRVKISEPKRGSIDKTQSITLPYDYKVSDTLQQALNYLIQRGFNIVGRGSTAKKYILFADNWAEDYITLK